MTYKKPPNLNFSPTKDPICRVLPIFVAMNFDEFFLQPVPRYLPKIPVKDYVSKLKRKIACMKLEFIV